MKKKILYLSIPLFPLTVMILVNEFARMHSHETGIFKDGIITINSAKSLKEKCSWICHNNTAYCKEHHVKLAQSHYDKIDSAYFGIINSLKSTGNYGLANIIVFVIILPLFMYLLLVEAIRFQFKIRKLKQQ